MHIWYDFLVYYFTINCVVSHIILPKLNLDELCFDELSYIVVEGDRLDFDLVLSRRLPYSLAVKFEYRDLTAFVSKLTYYIS